MKMLVGIIIGLIGSIVVILFDIHLVKYILTLVSVSDYAGLRKVVIVFISIWLTAGICIIPFAIGFCWGEFLENKI